MTQDPARLAHLLGPCPDCGNGRLAPVVNDEGMTNLLCRTCGSCWHVEFEWSHRVDPARCTGCPARGVCQARRPLGAPVAQVS